MPRQVDHEKRRRHVAEIAAELVAGGGVEALTVRNVAEAAGYSTAIVSHYFADKRDLLVSTYRTAADRARDRFEEAAATGSDPLRDCLEALLPVTGDQLRDWRLWFAFWGHAVGDPVFASEQRDRADSARARIERVLRAECSRGRLDAGVDVAHTARRLLLIVHGIGLQAVFDAGYWTPRRQREALAAELDRVRHAGHGLGEPVTS